MRIISEEITIPFPTNIMIIRVAMPLLMLAVTCPYVLNPGSERRAVHPVVVLNPGGCTLLSRLDRSGDDISRAPVPFLDVASRI